MSEKLHVIDSAGCCFFISAPIVGFKSTIQISLCFIIILSIQFSESGQIRVILISVKHDFGGFLKHILPGDICNNTFKLCRYH